VQPARSPTGRPAEVLLLRHAPTRWNDQHRRLGWADQPLTAAGRQASREWAQSATASFAVVCSSDLRRARDTATIIAAALEVDEVRELAALREQDQGEWTGLTKEQIRLRWPERSRERPRRPVGGEPPEAVLARVLPALASLAAEHAGRRVLAITHSGVIRMLERALSVADPPVSHLEGRWVRVWAGGRTQLEEAAGWLSVGEPTRGRVGAKRTGAGVKRTGAGVKRTGAGCVAAGGL
jgi:broad specificity phosphatase PhoE